MLCWSMLFVLAEAGWITPKSLSDTVVRRECRDKQLKDPLSVPSDPSNRTTACPEAQWGYHHQLAECYRNT